MNREQLILNLIGIAKRAGKLALGTLALEAVRSKEARIVFLAFDASNGTKKKYRDKCRYYDVELDETFSIDDLSKAVGLNNRVVVAVLDQGIVKKMKSY